mmetsp:Transcript_27758/g.43328  ORF Transcript_27758/g.43328 Transcript_27758/m.43328 type:complete len:92 (+) Transcript_27758:597-872(+)
MSSQDTREVDMATNHHSERGQHRQQVDAPRVCRAWSRIARAAANEWTQGKEKERRMLALELLARLLHCVQTEQLVDPGLSSLGPKMCRPAG